MNVRARVSAETIDVAGLLDGAAAAIDGAVVLFLGTVRNHNEGRSVIGVHYDAYQAMAEQELTRVLEDAQARFAVTRVVAEHRIGALTVGEVSVAIAVAAPHRAPAYDASRYIIEEIKRRLPVWKAEQYEDGEQRWLPGEEPSVRETVHE